MGKTARLIILVLVGIGIIGTVETAFNPENVMAAPFKPTAILALEAVVKVQEIGKDAKTVAASEELRIVSGAVTAMMLTNNIYVITPVTGATNNMAIFPSPQNPLYPDYIKDQTTEFYYTVDDFGKVTLSSTGVTSDPNLDDLMAKLNKLKGE